jgi:hypothetical protein
VLRTGPSSDALRAHEKLPFLTDPTSAQNTVSPSMVGTIPILDLVGHTLSRGILKGDEVASHHERAGHACG